MLQLDFFENNSELKEQIGNQIVKEKAVQLSQDKKLENLIKIVVEYRFQADELQIQQQCSSSSSINDFTDLKVNEIDKLEDHEQTFEYMVFEEIENLYKSTVSEKNEQQNFQEIQNIKHRKSKSHQCVQPLLQNLQKQICALNSQKSEILLNKKITAQQQPSLFQQQKVSNPHAIANQQMEIMSLKTELLKIKSEVKEQELVILRQKTKIGSQEEIIKQYIQLQDEYEQNKKIIRDQQFQINQLLEDIEQFSSMTKQKDHLIEELSNNLYYFKETVEKLTSTLQTKEAKLQELQFQKRNLGDAVPQLYSEDQYSLNKIMKKGSLISYEKPNQYNQNIDQKLKLFLNEETKNDQYNLIADNSKRTKTQQFVGPRSAQKKMMLTRQQKIENSSNQSNTIYNKVLSAIYHEGLSSTKKKEIFSKKFDNSKDKESPISRQMIKEQSEESYSDKLEKLNQQNCLTKSKVQSPVLYNFKFFKTINQSQLYNLMSMKSPSLISQTNKASLNMKSGSQTSLLIEDYQKSLKKFLNEAGEKIQTKEFNNELKSFSVEKASFGSRANTFKQSQLAKTLNIKQQQFF